MQSHVVTVVMVVAEMTTPRYQLTSSEGFSLIEVLVALLVLSVGLVGLAGLQITSLQRTQSSLFTTLATAAALDFEEQVWIELAEKPDSGCLSDTALQSIGQALRTTWASSSSPMGIPGLTVEVRRGTQTDDFVPVTLELSWTDSRMADSAESFTYEVQAICRPDIPGAGV